MKAVDKIEFEANLVLERSCSPVLEDLGKGKCSMEYWNEDGIINNSGRGIIEWIYFIETEDENAEEIGIWYENKTLTDFDGVFNLPKEAITLLNKIGIRVPKEFRN